MGRWKKRVVVGLMAMTLLFETMPMNVFAAEGKTTSKTEDLTDVSMNTVSGNEVAIEGITKEIEKELQKELQKEMEIPAVTTGENVRTGTLGDRRRIQWSYDESTKTLTVTGEDSGLSGMASMGSPFINICSDVEKVIFQDCTLEGSINYLLCKLQYLKSVEFNNFDTTNVTSMMSMFENCTSLESLDLSELDTSNVLNMRFMFKSCSSLKSLDLSVLDTTSVIGMRFMFANCSSLESLNLSNVDTSNVIDMYYMFAGCTNLKSLDLSSFNTSNVTEMYFMFEGCSSLKSLDLSGFDTTKVTSMYYMFSDCSSLESVDLSGLNTANVTYMNLMFSGCSSLTDLDLSSFDTTNVTTMLKMFKNCSSLKSLNISGFDTVNVEHIDDMLFGCTNLLSVYTPKAMATEHRIALPYMFYDEQENGVAELTANTCNKLLVKNLIVVAPPSFEIKGVINGRDVTFHCETEGATIYYSATTSRLTLNDKHVEAGETVTFSDFYGTLYARAYLDGKWSNLAKLVLKIPRVNKPTITQSGNSVTIMTTTPSCTIYYTTDGSTPSPTNGTKVNGSSCTIPSVSGTLRAIAVRSCFTNSEVASMSFVTNAVKVPSFAVVGVIGGRSVTFMSETAGSRIYYSASSTITTQDSYVNNGDSVVFENFYGTIYARTYFNGKWSNVSKLILKIPAVNTPTIEEVSEGRVKIKTTTPNSTIYYTTDGSTPSPTNGYRMSASSAIVYVGSGKTVKAIAVRSCFANSAVATGRTR